MAAGLLDRGICSLIPLEEVFQAEGRPVLNGMFGVPKGEKEASGVEVLRLIMDLRPTLGGDLGTLPILSHMNQFSLHPHEDLVISSEDVKAMFYVISIPPQWKPFLAFGKLVPSCLLPPGENRPHVLTSRVLPMGFVSSVSIAQHLHRQIVLKATDRAGLGRGQEIRRDKNFLETDLAFRVYLDNFDTLAKTSKEAAELIEGTSSEVVSSLLAEYQTHEVPRNAKKSVAQQPPAEVQGDLIDGVAGRAAAKPEKLSRYVWASNFLLSQQKCRQKQIQVVAGGLVYAVSYRRFIMCAMNEIWAFITSFQSATEEQVIPRRVKQEIRAVLALLPLASMNFRRAYDAVVSCSDASEKGGGLCVSHSLTGRGWPH